MDRAELLTRIHDGRAELESVLEQFGSQLRDQPLLANGWSVKDVVGHIGYWERRIATLYDILVRGDEPQDGVTLETVDELNARVYAENKSLSLEAIEADERQAYLALLQVAETAPDDHLFDAERFSWTGGEPFYNYIVENTYGHYVDHVPDLRAAAGPL